MTVFLPPSLQTEAHDLKDLGILAELIFTADRAPKPSLPNCSRRICFQAETDCCCPKLNGPNGAGGAELGPQAGDRSRRRQFAASLSVPAGAFGSSAGDPAGASPSRSDRDAAKTFESRPPKTCESRPANCASFFGKAAVVFEPFEWRPDLSVPGALHNSGNKPAPPSEHTPLGRRSAFLAAGVGSARGATSGITKRAPTGIEASFAR
jgi:hypothetical protein